MKPSSLFKSFLLTALAAFLCTGCMSTPPVVKPIKNIYYNYPGKNRPQTLIVLLHGKGGTERDFEKHGFIEAVRARNLQVDLVAVNGHLGYYFDRSLVRRLKKDVINPAKTKGYKNIWLVGISMGGLGSLLYTMENREDIDGIFLVAPFLGNSGVVQRIKKSGGLMAWDPQKARIEKWQKDLFTFIKRFSEPDREIPLVYLAYGTKDGYRPASLLIEKILPENRVFRRNGGHTWKTWQPLWVEFLENGPLSKSGE
ncbi:MAG: alpha/beta hydrolase [Deltaproteobacteria bacterium]|nr:alpha/beta hydrolase [Deltaproteobacteria bacterium]